MRKYALAIAAAILCASVSGCGATPDVAQTLKSTPTTEAVITTEETTAKPTPTPTPKPTPTPTPAPMMVAIGDVITTEDKEITINSVEFTDDILPDDTSNTYHFYESEDGEVFLQVDVEVKNLQKSDLMCDSIMIVKVDYNEGYMYTAYAYPEDSSWGFGYANTTSIVPLDTLGVRFAAACPDEVETSTDKPLLVVFKIDGEEYIYQMR